jgi:hypothetical protein
VVDGGSHVEIDSWDVYPSKLRINHAEKHHFCSTKIPTIGK